MITDFGLAGIADQIRRRRRAQRHSCLHGAGTTGGQRSHGQAATSIRSAWCCTRVFTGQTRRSSADNLTEHDATARTARQISRPSSFVKDLDPAGGASHHALPGTGAGEAPCESALRWCRRRCQGAILWRLRSPRAKRHRRRWSRLPVARRHSRSSSSAASPYCVFGALIDRRWSHGFGQARMGCSDAAGAILLKYSPQKAREVIVAGWATPRGHVTRLSASVR